MQILPLKGAKSLVALNAFGALLLGFKMLPAYITESYEEFYAKFKDKTDLEKEKLLREAVMFVQLGQNEIEAIVSFAADKNGIPYGPNNLKSLSLDELFEIVVSVAMEIGKMKIYLISEEEKKNSLSSQ